GIHWRNKGLGLDDARIRIGDYFSLKGNVNVLDALSSTPYFDLSLSSIQGNASELMALTRDFGLVLPEQVKSLGYFGFSGFFNGYKNDWLLEGNLKSDLGDLHVDLNMESAKDGTYAGFVKGTNLLLGDLYNLNWLGPISLECSLEGTGITDLKKLNVALEGEISSVEISNVHYSGISIKGKGDRNNFNGFVGIDDPNLDVQFNGGINFSGLPKFDFLLDVSRWELPEKQRENLGIETLEFNAKVQGQGFTWGKMNGGIRVDSLFTISEEGLRKNEGEIRLNFESKEGYTEAYLLSRFADVQLSGELNPLEAIRHLQRNYANLVKNIDETPAGIEQGTLDFNLVTKTSHPIIDRWIPNVGIGKLSSILAHINAKDDFANIHIKSDLSYKDYAAFVNLDLIMDEGIYEFDGKLDHLFIGEKEVVDKADFWLKSIGTTRQVTVDISGPKENQRLQLSTVGTVDSEQWYFELNSPSTLKLNNQIYKITNDLPIWFNSEGLGMAKISIANPQGSLDLEYGKMKGIGNYFASLVAEDFKIPKEVDIAGQEISGEIDGKIAYTLSQNNSHFLGDVYVRELAFGKLDFDELHIVSESIEDGRNPVFIDLSDGGKKLVAAKMEIDSTGKPTGRALINDFPLNAADEYLNKFIELSQGTVSGNLFWESESWIPRGRLWCSQGLIGVNYTQVAYRFEDWIEISPDYIGIDNGKLTDPNGRVANLTATYFPNTGKAWSYDIFINAPKSFKMLATTETSDQLFYGAGYGVGTVDISGNRYENYLDINVKSESGSKLFFPFYEGRNTTQEDGLVQFKSKTLMVEDTVFKTGLILDIKVAVDQGTQIEMILDDLTGEKIRGRGEGKMNIFTGENKSIEVVGSYEIITGEYLFTLQNIINRRFSLVPGSKISWYGDPFGADLDIKANYFYRISLATLVGNSSEINSSKRENVNLQLLLTGALLSPQIDFNFSLPEADDFSRGLVNSLITTKEERTRQAFSVLVLNQFAPTNQAGNGGFGQGVNSAGNDFLSYGLSTFLNQLSNRFTIDFQLRSLVEEATIQGREFDLNLSTQFFNNRLKVSGNLGSEQEVAQTQETQTQENYFGEFLAEYALTSNRKVLLKVFHERADRSLINLNRSRFVQGLGISYQRNFNRLFPLRKSPFKP
ncbi:MAG: hypothetical protein ACI9YL_001166, partial [Luteibaculaceae bacterium]